MDNICSAHYCARPSVSWISVSLRVPLVVRAPIKKHKFGNDEHESLSKGKWIEMEMEKGTLVQKTTVSLYFTA